MTSYLFSLLFECCLAVINLTILESSDDQELVSTSPQPQCWSFLQTPKSLDQPEGKIFPAEQGSSPKLFKSPYPLTGTIDLEENPQMSDAKVQGGWER